MPMPGLGQQPMTTPGVMQPRAPMQQPANTANRLAPPATTVQGGMSAPAPVAQPAKINKPVKAKTGLEGLTPQASLEPGRRRQIVDILSKHAERLPPNCAVRLVEKLVEKHAELALSGVTNLIEKSARKRVASKLSKVSNCLDPRFMRAFVKRSNDKPKSARLFARLVKVATILNSKG